MDKRLLTALVLCFALLWVHNVLFSPPEPPPEQKPAGQEQAASEEIPGIGDAIAEPAVEEAGEGQPGQPASVEAPVAGAGRFETSEVAAEAEIVLDTDNYRAVFSNRGAVLKSLKLKHYFIDSEVQKDPERMADPANWFEITGGVNEEVDSFVLKRAGAGKAGVLDDSLWESVSGGNESGAPFAEFTLKTADGLVYRKKFRLRDGEYHIDFRLEVENRDPDLKETANLVLGAIGGIYDGKRAAWTIGPTAVVCTSDTDKARAEPDIMDYKASSLEDEPFSFTLRPEERMHYAGVMTNYFAMLIQPGEGRLLRRVTSSVLEDKRKFRMAVEEYRDKNMADPPAQALQGMHANSMTNIQTDLLLQVRIPAPGKTSAQDFIFFAGPKLTDLMMSEPYDNYYALIEDAYGMLSWINKSLVWILKQFYALVGNWGVAIILLTFVVKIILYPFNRMQQVSMHRYQQTMGKLKPKLDELKKKFKNNKKKYNEAQMKLMKEHGATPPLAGCLLIFLQFPIFIGLFQVLRTAFELRHSPFCLWIKDLSQPDALPLPFTLPFIGDTLNVVPLLMTVAFFYQQKSMPQPTDPQAQQTQKIMKFMPFIFLFILYSYASGLSLYWMTSNIISIVEFRVIRKKFPVDGGADKPPTKDGPPPVAKSPPQSAHKAKGRKAKSGH